MKIITKLALALCLAFTPQAIAGVDDGPAMRCNGHMCPVARAATTVGYEVVTKLPMVAVEDGEFLA